MRSYYLNKSRDSQGCRGGVTGNHGDYELEVGQSCFASEEMIALCVMIDEITTYLQNSNCPVAKLLYDVYDKKVKEVREKYEADVAKSKN